MDFYIRDCKVEDYMAIAHLNKEEMNYDYPVEQTKIQLEKLLGDVNHKIYVAVSGEQVVGYIHANHYDLLYAPPMKNIMGIAVAKKYQKQGIGKALLTQVEAWAKKAGACGVRLVSGSERVGAHVFYKHCGYKECKEQKNFKKIFSQG